MPRVQINAPQITLLVRFIFELFEYAASFSPSVTPPPADSVDGGVGGALLAGGGDASPQSPQQPKDGEG